MIGAVASTLQSIDSAGKQELQTTATLIQTSIQQQSLKALDRADLISRLPPIQQAFRTNHRDQLLQTILPSFTVQRDRVEVATEGSRQRQTPGIWPLKKHDKGEYIFLNPSHELNLPPAPPLDEPKNPYRALESFDEEHSRFFFGRQTLTEQLYQQVLEQPLTVVLGNSGSGKSSLVKAGLIPYAKQISGRQWHILTPMRPGESPSIALNNILARELPVSSRWGVGNSGSPNARGD